MPINPRNYHRNWKDISRFIRTRALWRCQQCGAPDGAFIQRLKRNPAGYRMALQDEVENDEWHRPIKVVLTVAHLNHDTTDNRDENLMALCQRCHLVHDADHHARNARFTRLRKRIEAIRRTGQLPLWD